MFPCKSCGQFKAVCNERQAGLACCRHCSHVTKNEWENVPNINALRVLVGDGSGWVYRFEDHVNTPSGIGGTITVARWSYVYVPKHPVSEE